MEGRAVGGSTDGGVTGQTREESAANRTEAGSGGARREEQGWREVHQDQEAEEAPLGAAGGAVQGALGNRLVVLAIKARPSGGCVNPGPCLRAVKTCPG